MTKTIRDVARLAGVSNATVSRVLNGIPKSASAETQKRIMLAVNELGYLPNFIASSLKLTSTKTVGLIVSDIQNPFFSSIIKGIESILQKHNYSLILGDSNFSPELEKELANIFLQRKVDAMIIAPCIGSKGSWLPQAKEHNVHIILIDDTLSDTDIDSIVVDNFEGAYSATNYLINLGHKKIGMISGPNSRSTGYLRTRGYMKALKINQIVINTDLIQEGNFDTVSGYRCMQNLLSLQTLPTAVFIANNLMAIGALEAIHEKRIVIPEELSVICFDDMNWFPIITPSLSAVRQPEFELGVIAAKQILIRLNQKDQPIPEKIVLKTQLIVRESVKSLN